MGSGFDEVAKAVATGVPRRKVFKLLAGGVAAAVSATIMGRSASANGGFSIYLPGFNQAIYVNRPVAGRDLGLNRQIRALLDEPTPPVNNCGPYDVNCTFP